MKDGTYTYWVAIDVNVEDGEIASVVVLDEGKLRPDDDNAQKNEAAINELDWPAWQFGY